MKDVELLKNYDVIFWDFDGVIKESVEVKSNAFEQLFSPFGKEVAKRVRAHHEDNGGMSRFDKLQIYLEWVGQAVTQPLIDVYLKNFSDIVKQKVIDSEWVPGAWEYLENHSEKKFFFLVTATPQEEIEEIINELQIRKHFRKVTGSPTNKIEAIRIILAEFFIKADCAIMIGDSSSDYQAAFENHLNFALRRTNLNNRLQGLLENNLIENFLED